MPTKNYFLKGIKSSKIVNGEELKLGNNLVRFIIDLVPRNGPNMTINDLAKKLDALTTTVDTGFKKVNERLDKLEAQVAKHSEVFERNGLI